MGRPPVEHPRVHSERFRTNEAEHSAIAEAASAAGVPLSDFLRNTTMREIDRLRKKADREFKRNHEQAKARGNAD